MKRPTHVNGPAMIFNNIEGFDDARVLIGLLASRKRAASLFGCSVTELHKVIYDCVKDPIQPVVIDGPVPCQEVVHLASDPDFDLHKPIPAPPILLWMPARILHWVCAMLLIPTPDAAMLPFTECVSRERMNCPYSGIWQF